MSHSPRPAGVASGVLTAAFLVACSSSKTDAPSTLTTKSAAVAGAIDSHCAGKPVVVANAAVCDVKPDGGGAGAGDGGAGEAAADYGPTQFNSDGDDDDCKYHVAWESTDVAQNEDVTFAIVATNRSDSSPVAQATPYAEIFLDGTPAPNTPVKTSETAPGKYTIGPVKFDKPGNWNVRFHFHAECNDSKPSPHGHVAFFVKVP